MSTKNYKKLYQKKTNIHYIFLKTAACYICLLKLFQKYNRKSLDKRRKSKKIEETTSTKVKESVRHLQWRDWTKLVTWTVSNTSGILENEKAPAGYINKNSNNGKIENARREASAEEKDLSLFGIPPNRAHPKWDSANSNN